MTPDLKVMAMRCALTSVAFLMLPLTTDDGLSWRYAAAFAQAPGEPSGVSEKEAFEAAKALGTVEAWDAFLSNYPKGFHADLARAYVKKLAAPAAASPAAVPAQSAVLEQAIEVPCSDAAKLKSYQSTDPVKIRFINESGTQLVIQWIDFNGSLKEYAVLEPGAELTQDTFLTHPWIAAYMEGSCRQLFMPGQGVSVARLVPDAQLSNPSAQRVPSKRKASQDDGSGDHGATPEQTCRNIGQDYNGIACVPRKSAQPSKATIERRARAACVDIGMIYLNGKCAPKKKSERNTASKNKNKACPKGTYRNPYGQCQPNETGG